ncbi:hypothetical protein HDK64DRAFT_20646 [Phyllosticta capitalensis]
MELGLTFFSPLFVFFWDAMITHNTHHSLHWEMEICTNFSKKPKDVFSPSFVVLFLSSTRGKQAGWDHYCNLHFCVFGLGLGAKAMGVAFHWTGVVSGMTDIGTAGGKGVWHRRRRCRCRVKIIVDGALLSLFIVLVLYLPLLISQLPPPLCA